MANLLLKAFRVSTITADARGSGDLMRMVAGDPLIAGAQFESVVDSSDRIVRNDAAA